MKQSEVVGIYLAAGKSSRMGVNKLNLPIGNQFVGSMAFKAALESKLKTTIAVTRKGDPLHWLTPFLNKKGWSLLECMEADHGQSASLKAGVLAARERGAEAVVILLGDQPLVTCHSINDLIAQHKAAPDLAFIAYLHHGIPKPPVLMTKRFFSSIEELTGDQGARAIIRQAQHGQGKLMEMNEAAFFYDVDTKENYQDLLENWKASVSWEG